MKNVLYILLTGVVILLTGCSKDDNSNPDTVLSGTLYAFGGNGRFPNNYIFSVNPTTGDLTPFDTPGTFTEEFAIMCPLLIPNSHIAFGFSFLEIDELAKFGYFNFDTKQRGELLIENNNVDNRGGRGGCIGILNDKPHVILSYHSEEAELQRLDLCEFDISTAKSKLVASVNCVFDIDRLIGHFGYDKATNTIVFGNKAMYFWNLNTNTISPIDANMPEDGISSIFPFRGGTACLQINNEDDDDEKQNIFMVDFKNKKCGDFIATMNMPGENIAFTYDEIGDKLYFICEENSYYVDVYDFKSRVQSHFIPDDEERAIYGLILMK